MNQSSQKHNEEKLSYANIVTRNFQPQNAFLGQHPVNQHFIGQAVQVQEPFIVPKTHIQQPILEPQSNQKQIIDLLLSLNQRMINLEKQKIQN